MAKKKKLKSKELLRKGNKLWHDGHPQSALEAYKKAIEELPPDAPAQDRVEITSAYALCLCETGDFDQALSLYSELDRLCKDNGLDDKTVLRQWAKALEQSGDFVAARKTYEMSRPDDQTQPIDRLKWNHAMGLLNWRDGRLTEARENLSAATDLMPEDQGEASALIAVLGNDALLSLELGDFARALRLADQMIEIRRAAGGTTLSNEINLIRVRAALEKRRGDHAQEAAILHDGIAMLEDRVPDDWMRRLDLMNDYVAASLEVVPNSNAIAHLSEMCDAAPVSVAWISRFMLARLQIKAGEIDAAKGNLAHVLWSFAGSGSAASEVEIIIELASLCERCGNRAASVLLGKLTLKYLSEIAHAFEGAALQNVVEAGQQITKQTTTHLRALSRFEEALALNALLERIQRYALVLREGPAASPAHQPVPFDQAELEAEENWLRDRQVLAKMRAEGHQEKASRIAARMIDDLIGFENNSGLASRPANITPPSRQNLRLSFVPSGDVCVVHYLWSERAKTKQLDVSEQAFFALVANLREAVADRDAWQKPAATLYRHLIAPIRDDLGQIDCLEIDASGILGRIPFCLLGDTGQSLVQQVAIKYVANATPSTSKVPARSGLLHCSAFATGPLASGPASNMGPIPSLAPLTRIDSRGFTRDGFLKGLATSPRWVSIATHFDSEPTRPDHWSLQLGTQEPLYLSDFGGEHFDLLGIDIALLATCSSGLDDATKTGQNSLAILALEKGVKSFVGTLWDISESAAARFIDEFWGAFCESDHADPAIVLAEIQSRHAESAQQGRLAPSATGGIGDPAGDLVPGDWAAFAVFENGNNAQHQADQIDEDLVTNGG